MDPAMAASTVGGTVAHITTYEELRDSIPENYGMGFTEADPNPVVDMEIDEEVLASLLEAIQVPVGAVGGPAASAGAHMDIYLPEPNAATAAGLPQPVGDDCHTTAAGMEIILHGQSAHIEFDSSEVNAGLTQPAPNTHSVRQHQQPPAQHYFSLIPLQHQLLANSQPTIFFSHTTPTSSSSPATSHAHAGDPGHSTAMGIDKIMHMPEVAGVAQPAPNMVIDILHMPEATTAYLSIATDREILDEIRAAIISEEKMHLFHTEHIHEAQAKTDPTDLKGTVWYVTSRILGHTTNHGCYWKGKNCEIVFTADNNEQSSGGLDRYIGLKRTLEFHKKGTKTNWPPLPLKKKKKPKTNWLMHEYIPLDQHSDHLFFKDQLVLRKVFRNDKGKGLAAEHNNDEDELVLRKVFRNDKGKGLAAEHNNDEDGYSRDINDEINHGSKIASDGKRCNKRRPSDVWNHFIKIYDKHPRSDGSNLVYGVCRYCDRVLIATTDNGTKSLIRHNTDSCKNSPNKHRQPSSS